MIGLAGARDLDAAIGAFVDALEPDAIAHPDVVPIWETVVAGAQRMNAAVTLLARRVEETSAWERTGHRSAAEFLAKRSGTSIAAARTQLDTARKVDELPAIEQRLRSGALSGAQAALVVEGASVNPDATDRLLEQAEQGSLKDLRDEVLRIRAATDPDPDTTQRRIQSRRGYRSWRDGEGGWHAALYGTALAGARFETRLKPLIDHEFANARADGRHEPRDASAFDAVMALADQPAGDDAKKPTPRFTTIVRVDLDALRRGTLDEPKRSPCCGPPPCARLPAAATPPARSTTATPTPRTPKRASTTSTRCASTTTRSRPMTTGPSSKAEEHATWSPHTTRDTPRTNPDTTRADPRRSV